ncbi:MAG: M15 family metallopeptidase, partial [Candidatus Rokuibacteriota bacterium]
NTLSNHAWGAAFDLNEEHNLLGHVPGLRGERGAVRELVPYANELGFYWGGHFLGRADGTHFEVARPLG